MVPWENKQNRKTVSQTHGKKKERRLNKIGKENENVATDNTKIQRIIRGYYQKLCQLNGQLGRNGQILRKV